MCAAICKLTTKEFPIKTNMSHLKIKHLFITQNLHPTTKSLFIYISFHNSNINYMQLSHNFHIWFGHICQLTLVPPENVWFQNYILHNIYSLLM